MEFLKVNYLGASRVVLANGNPAGHTNTVITFPLSGIYSISLESPTNYVPEVQEITLTHTGPFTPLELTFHRLPPSVPGT